MIVNEETLMVIISDAFSVYQCAYRPQTKEQPYPRNRYKDVCEYAAYKVATYLKNVEK